MKGFCPFCHRTLISHRDGNCPCDDCEGMGTFTEEWVGHYKVNPCMFCNGTGVNLVANIARLAFIYVNDRGEETWQNLSQEVQKVKTSS